MAKSTRSIAAQAVANHPNWSGAKKPSAPSGGLASAGSALLSPTPSRGSGVGAAGSALLQQTTTPGASGGAAGLTTAPSTAPTTTTTTTPAAAVAPFLTAAQSAALTKWNTTYAGDLANLTQGDTNAWSTYNQGVSTDQFKNSEDIDTANQNAAARGFALSSIRQGALNDLAVTLASQLNILQTNRDATLSSDQTQRTTLGGEDAATQTEYWGPGGLAVVNAQAVPPDTSQSTTTTTTPGTSAPAAAHPAPGSAQPVTLAPGISQAGAALTAPHTPSLAAAGSALITHAAALRAANPKPPLARAPGVGNAGLGAFGNLTLGKVGAPV